MTVSWEEGRRILHELLESYGLPFRTEAFWSELWRFLERLILRAEELNLTAVTDFREKLRTQVLESLVLAAHLPQGGYRLADLGSGGGIPGLILKLVRPELEVILFEAYAPRVEFMREIIRELGLSGVWAEVCHLGQEWPAEKFPVVVGRGYGSVAKFVSHAERLLTPPALAFYLWRNEVEPWGDLVSPLIERHSFFLPDQKERVLLVFRRL